MRSIALACAALASASAAVAQEFVVANRGSADLSVFDREGTLQHTVPLPPAASTPEPMYVVQVGDEVVVGDRANDRIVRFDRETYQVNGAVAVGRGVFHMWAAFGQLWVVNDLDLTWTVIDTESWTVVASVPVPQDLAAQGYRPHDVFVGSRFVYASLLGGTGDYDWVIQFDRTDILDTARTPVGKDPHLWLDPWSDSLYVASQDASALHVFDRGGLRVKGRLSLSGAHGIFVPAGTRTLLVADFTSDGPRGLFANALDAAGRPETTDVEDLPVGTPHNIAASSFGQRIFVTHSGASSTAVSIYELVDGASPQIRFLRTVTAGTNPFGIAVVRG